jgi:hypothetical protein
MLVIVLLANGLLQNVLQPVAFGATLGLNPLVVLMVTIAAGSLFGMVGLILAAPLTSAAVRISADLARAGAAERRSTATRAPPAPSAAGTQLDSSRERSDRPAGDHDDGRPPDHDGDRPRHPP